jgi:hypothetical protein
MKLFCEYDRFELEQDIIKSWGVVDMIDELIRQHLDRPEGAFSEDELANRLEAIKYVTEMQFQRLWDGFEVMIKKGHFTKTRFGDAPEVAVADTDDEKLFEILTTKKGSKKK